MSAVEHLPFHAMPWTARPFFTMLERLAHGHLTLRLPDGTQRTYGDAEGIAASLEIRDWAAIGRIMRGAEIGLFETWRDGLVTTPDMTALLRLAIRNQAALGEAFYGHPVVAFAARIAHALRANTRRGARRNIHAHYDLGNDFYALWLDGGMSYSSAIFKEVSKELGAQDFPSAQDAKYDRLIDLLAIEEGQRVLEVGCGWGGFAERAARLRGCHVTGLTLSQAQLDFARQRIHFANLTHRVDLRFCDYRDAQGTYDRIASIEMLEAVGERYWPTYFRTLHDRLAPGGRAAIQSIVIAPEAFERYRSSSDFIREYIFPGGMLPTTERIAAEARAAGLQVEEPFHFGRDYAETIRHWRAAFDAAEPEVRRLGFDERFLATWRFYLDTCEAGFEEGRIDVVQVALVRS